MKQDEFYLLKGTLACVGFTVIYEVFYSLHWIAIGAFLVSIASLTLVGAALYWEFLSKTGRENRKRIDTIREIPQSLLLSSSESVLLGRDLDLEVPIHLPDTVRSRHVHIMGATGSGKTESVILNLLKQDIARGLGSIILDAKGDTSFLTALAELVPNERLTVFDLSDPNSLSYNPLVTGSPLEAAQRLFSSLVWSEEYYKAKSFSALQTLFKQHHKINDSNPKLTDLAHYLKDYKTFSSFVKSPGSGDISERDYADLSGLRSQIDTLCIAHLSTILSGGQAAINLSAAKSGQIIYFRLQSLLSPQLVSIVGRLLINHLSYLAGTAHREGTDSTQARLVPVYLDEFASFACPEFADLISKARSAKYALHFSHQSIGDITAVSDSFLNQIADNSGTKIVLRINDPDSADYIARTFGTKLYKKVTQRVTNVKDIDRAEILEEGSQREAHQFRASPDLLKTLPTGVGSVLIAHGSDTSHGASTVFKIRFPRLSL